MGQEVEAEGGAARGDAARPKDRSADAGPKSGSAGQGESGPPGPLAMAASAARVEAEARIKASLQQTRMSRHAAPESADGEGEGEAEPGDPQMPGSHEKPAAGSAQGEAQARTEAALRALAELSQPVAGQQAPDAVPSRRPEVASGARPSLAVGQALGPSVGRALSSHPYAQLETPGPTVTGPEDTKEVPGLGKTDPAGPDAEFEDRPEHPAGYPRRNRIARGYSIPRLSRSKKPGAVPGT